MELLNKLIKKPTLYSAWRLLKKNPESQGVDGVKIKTFQDDLNNNINKIRNDLKSGEYKFTLLKGRLIPKGENESRALKIQAVRDRVVQRAIRVVVDRYFRKFNYPCSFGYIQRRSREDALAEIIKLRNKKYKHVLEADICGFFDAVNQDILKEKIFKILPDNSLNQLIEDGLNTEIGNKELFSNDDITQYFADGSLGISQGGILSPLYANLYLCEFDKMMLEHKFKLIRYADDFVVLCKSKDEALDAHSKSEKFLEGKLNLRLHSLGSKKTRVVNFSQGFNFLGFSFNRNSFCPNVKSRKKFVARIVEVTTLSKKDNVIDRAISLRNTIRGWGNAYSFCHSENLKVNKNDKTMTAIFETFDKKIREKFFCLLGKCELKPAGKRWGEYHLKKFDVPILMEYLTKRNLEDIQKKRKKIRKKKKTSTR